MLPHVRALLLWVHLAGVVVWFGAVAYFLLVLRPAARSAGLERKGWYALLREIKARLKRVVGVAVAAVVLSGLGLAHLRGLLRWEVIGHGWVGGLLAGKLVLAALLVAVFASALPLIARLRQPRLRARAFTATHLLVLALGAIAAYLGILLRG